MAPIQEPTSTSFVQATSDITEKFKEILMSNGINERVSEVLIKESGLKGENFASVTDYITVKFTNPEKAPLNLFVKKHSENKGHMEMVIDGKLFEKEAMFFMKYVPAAMTYCKSIGRENLMSIYPKCYYGDEKLMVFENLVLDKEYCLLDKVEKQGMEAATLSLKSLATHHAISNALIKEKGGPTAFFEEYPLLEFKGFLCPAMRNMMEPPIENGLSANIQLLEKSGLKQSKEYAKILKGFTKPYQTIIDLMEDETSNKFVALNHGDYWNNNMMFRRDPVTGKLVDHIAVDLQVTYYGAPTLDIGYFLYTSVEKNVRQTRLQELLQIYFDCLKTTATELGHPIDITIEDLHKCYCKNFKFGFYFGCFLMSEAGMTVMKSLDIAKFENMRDFLLEFQRLVAEWIDSNPERGQRIAKVLIDDLHQYSQLEKGIVEFNNNNNQL